MSMATNVMFVNMSRDESTSNMTSSPFNVTSTAQPGLIDHVCGSLYGVAQVAVAFKVL